MRLIDADALDLDREVELADDWKTAHEIANCVKYAPTIDAIPVHALAQWLAGYAAPPAYALDAARHEDDFLTPNHLTRAWEHHLHTLIESGLMEEEKSE